MAPKKRRGLRRSIRGGDADSPEDTFADLEEALDRPAPLHLRRLQVEEALELLYGTIRDLLASGKKRLVVVHGRGRGSPGGVSVLGPAVRRWCDEHPKLVAGWREAPRSEGGPGAIIVELR